MLLVHELLVDKTGDGLRESFGQQPITALR
jgi:hypothetical protein